MSTHSKSVHWAKVKEAKGFKSLYGFTEINTAEYIATIAASCSHIQFTADKAS